jgi:hypothetical protein
MVRWKELDKINVDNNLHFLHQYGLMFVILETLKN